MSALIVLALLLAPACLEAPDNAVDGPGARGQPHAPGGPGGQPGAGSGPHAGQPPGQPGPPTPGGGAQPEPGSLPPLPGGLTGQGGPAVRAPGPLRVAMVPSSRAVLLYKALVNQGSKAGKGEQAAKADRGGVGGPGELAGQTARRDALGDVQLLAPAGEALALLGPGREAFKASVGTYEAPVGQPSAGLAQVAQALKQGDVDCGVLPIATLIGLADTSGGTGQALVLVAQLGSAGGENSDLVTVVRAGKSTTTPPKATRSGTTSGLDARLLLAGLVPGQHQVLGDDALGAALSAGTVDLVVAPRDTVAPLLASGAVEAFRPLTPAEAAPSAQALACRVSTLGSKDARDALKSLLRVYRGYLKRRGPEDKTAIGGHYPETGLVDLGALDAMLAKLKAQQLVTNAALEIIDLQTLAGTQGTDEGPIGASAVLVDNRMVAARGGDEAGRGQKRPVENDLELPPPPDATLAPEATPELPAPG